MNAPFGRGAQCKSTLAGMLAHLRSLMLALFLCGCGFSGPLYLPEEPPPAPGEQPAPEVVASQSGDSSP